MLANKKKLAVMAVLTWNDSKKVFSRRMHVQCLVSESFGDEAFWHQTELRTKAIAKVLWKGLVQ